MQGMTGQSRNEWLPLIAAIRDEMNKGTPPDDPAVGQLVRQGLASLNKLTGGDPGALQRLIAQYQANPGLGAALGLDPTAFAYIMRAIAAT